MTWPRLWHCDNGSGEWLFAAARSPKDPPRVDLKCHRHDTPVMPGPDLVYSGDDTTPQSCLARNWFTPGTPHHHPDSTPPHL